MSFSDFATRLRAQSDNRTDTAHQPRNFDEIHALRARILGVLIRDARTFAGLSVEGCAAQIGVSAETLADWEYGNSMPSLPQIELLAYVLDVPIGHFWGAETLATQAERRTIDQEQYVLIRGHLIGALLRDARQRRGLSADQLAEVTGLTPARLEAYETGQRAIPLPVLVTLADACNVNLSHFLETGNRVGDFLAAQEDVERFRALPPDLRRFVATPINQSYLELAMRLSQMSSSELRGIAEAILNITL